MEKICPFIQDICIEDECLAWEEEHCIVLDFYRNHQTVSFPQIVTTISNENGSQMDKVQPKYPISVNTWTPQEDANLKSRFQQGLSVEQLAIALQRQPQDIRSRLSRLELLPIDIDTIEPKTLVSENNKGLFPARASLEERNLMEELKRWRLNAAREAGWPAYVIAHNTVLEDLISYRINTLDGLFRVRGLGRKKVEKYGQELLKILTKYFPAH